MMAHGYDETAAFTDREAPGFPDPEPCVVAPDSLQPGATGGERPTTPVAGAGTGRSRRGRI
ncbi:hypothetical protein [Longispora fulva]|uniref:Uncharacterized protein n=1 Tax=Longispora fulva TaxID=619741 RepID=A0A8J7GCE9_9ACTN|nr:hypothetical protein [Longispora fulva]MBG6135041.1 hypothetical protein [Longispora fulva]